MTDIQLAELKVVMPSGVERVPPFDCLLVQRIKVVDGHHLVALIQKRIGEMAADESSPTCDQNSREVSKAAMGRIGTSRQETRNAVRGESNRRATLKK